MTLAEEKELIAQCKRNPLAFGKIFDEYFEVIFNYILYRVMNVTLAQDLTSQTFYRALNSLWKFRWTGVSISAWLYQIATNEVNGFFRNLKKRPEHSLEDVAENLKGTKFAPDAELEAAEMEMSKNETFSMLASVIRDLDDEEQSLITLRYFEKKPFQEIAQILNKREGTLRMRSKRALEKLKHKLGERGVDDEKFRRTFIESGETDYQGEYLSSKSAPGIA